MDDCANAILCNIDQPQSKARPFALVISTGSVNDMLAMTPSAPLGRRAAQKPQAIGNDAS